MEYNSKLKQPSPLQAAFGPGVYHSNGILGQGLAAAKPDGLWQETSDSHKFSSVAWVSTHNKHTNTQTNKKKGWNPKLETKVENNRSPWMYTSTLHIHMNTCVHAYTLPDKNMLHTDTLSIQKDEPCGNMKIFPNENS